MATTPKTSIATPRAFDLKALQTLAEEVKSRFTQVDSIAQVAKVRLEEATSSAGIIDALQGQVASLSGAVTALANLVNTQQSTIAALLALPPGIMVRTSTGFVTRTLEGDGITIDNPNGVLGNPRFYLSPLAVLSRSEDDSLGFFDVPADAELWQLLPP